MGSNNLVLLCYPVRCLSDLVLPIKNNFSHITAVKIMDILLNEVIIEDYFDEYSILLYITTVNRFFDDVGEIKKHNANIFVTFPIDRKNDIYLKISGSTSNRALYLSLIKSNTLN